MPIVDKIRFDADIAKATPLQAVDLCLGEVARIYRESETIGGRKWTFSQLRKGRDMKTVKALLPPRGTEVSREGYGRDVATAIVRLAGQGVSPDVLRDIVVLSLVRLDAKDSLAYRDESRDAVVKDLDPTRGRRGIMSVDGFIDIATGLLDGRSYLDRLLGICAVTGRRTFEAGCTAVFEVKGENTLLFTGQAKTRGREKTDSFEIPTLASARKIVETLSTIREDRPDLTGLTSIEFHNRAGKDLHKRAQIFAPVLSPHTASPKDLRSVWGKLVWILFDEQRTGMNLYLSRVLGHSEDDLGTSMSYDDFVILDPDYL